jgi:voltage-gated potassium channel
MLMEISVAVMMLALCLLLHVAGVLGMAEWLLQHREYRERKGVRMRYAVLLLLLFSGLMCLHITEAILWAAFYYTRALFNDFETSLYFSLTSYSTIGYGDVLLPQRWRLLGAVEGVSGVLLCGISTAFIFAVITAMFQIRLQHQATLSEVTVTPAA